MILLDTNVIVYARDKNSPFNQWAEGLIAESVSEGGEGACINAVTLAELCAADGVDELQVSQAVRAFGVDIIGVPAACAPVCGAAYRKYRKQRKSESGKDAHKVPLPDFFIGAQALVENLPLATNDAERIKTYFPQVNLRTPAPETSRH